MTWGPSLQESYRNCVVSLFGTPSGVHISPFIKRFHSIKLLNVRFYFFSVCMSSWIQEHYPDLTQSQGRRHLLTLQISEDSKCTGKSCKTCNMILPSDFSLRGKTVNQNKKMNISYFSGILMPSLNFFWLNIIPF